MLSYSEIKKGSRILHEGVPYEVIEAVFAKKNRQKGVNQTKVKNLRTGFVKNISFHPSDKVTELEVEKENVIFIYEREDKMYFHKEDNKSDRFGIDKKFVTFPEFISANMKVEALKINDKIISITPPIKVNLKVVESPPSVKGNTAQSGTKKVKLETGAFVNTPLFIKKGDSITVNTQTGEYVERSK